MNEEESRCTGLAIVLRQIALIRNDAFADENIIGIIGRSSGFTSEGASGLAKVHRRVLIAKIDDL
jgi:hypothetical protein